EFGQLCSESTDCLLTIMSNANSYICQSEIVKNNVHGPLEKQGLTVALKEHQIMEGGAYISRRK
ncbi:hypothetical protein PRIPAC_88614, partial [Pristionchus pacificus]